MANEKFFFIFSEQPNKRLFIDEPIGYFGIPFILQRQDDGMGLDVTLNGDENTFRLTIERDHQLPEMIYYRDRYGFEANVLFGIIFENQTELINQVDFQASKTDDYSYFEFSCITVSSQQLFKRQVKTKVDMFSSLGVNGEFINPLIPYNMLLQAKPSIQESTWKIASEVVIKESNLAIQVNIAQSILTSDVKDTYNPFPLYVKGNGNGGDFLIMTAQSNLKDVVLNIKNLKIKVSGGVDKRARIILKKGYNIKDPGTYTEVQLGNFVALNGDLVIQTDILNYAVGDFQRDENLWLYVLVFQTLAYELTTTVTSSDISLSGTSTAYNTIVPSFRLIDVMRQIAKSTAGLEIIAPRYDTGGEFYDTVLTNGKMLGGNITDPFYISWEDLIESVKGEGHGGFEISLDGKIFVGIEEDFYTNVECGVFEDIQFDSLEKATDPKMAINTFKLNFSNYQSLKENTEPNSGSTIHGETILTLPNTEVEGVLEVKIPWIRDAILLDVQQRLSTIVSKDTATQDDDKVFAIDTLPTENDQQFTESTELHHTDNTGFLSLKSDGNVNFLVLGIRQGTSFQILLPDPNAGVYTVSAIFNTELQLTGGSFSSSNNGARLTKYTYEIKKETIPLTNRTNEGFDSVENLISPDKYSNLRYSVERTIRKRWVRFLAGCNLWKKDKNIINTYYKNNGACITNYDGLLIQEKENFSPDVDPIYTSNWYEGITFANVDFEDFVALCNRLRLYHGYITMKDINRRILQIYPEKLSYQNDTRAIAIDGNEKFIKAYMTITNENNIIVVNEETIVTVLKWDLIDRKVELFDLERQRLYQGVFWYKIAINGSIAETLAEFIDRMNLIGEKFDSTKY